MSRHNKLVYDENAMVYDEKNKSYSRGKASHVSRERNLQRYKKGTHKPGQFVEFIGRDVKKRGMGIVIREVTINGTYSVSEHTHLKDEDYCFLQIFWQVDQREEICHKEMVRKVVIEEKGIIVKKQKHVQRK